MHCTNLKNIVSLIDLLLAIPATSAEVERGFSYMKCVKTDWRSRLRDTMLTDLLRIQIDSPEISDYEPSAAIDMWLSSGLKAKRPWHKPYRKRVAKQEEEESDTDSGTSSDDNVSDSE